MTEEQKPKKKKLSIMSVLGDPGKAVAQLMEDPDIIAKLPEVLAKCPPAAMQALACSIAPYLPPTKIEDGAVARATNDVVHPAVHEHIAKNVNPIPENTAAGTGNIDESIDLTTGPRSTMVLNELSEFRKQLVQLTASIKAIQDELPRQIQAQVATIIKAELEAVQKQVEPKNKS